MNEHTNIDEGLVPPHEPEGKPARIVVAVGGSSAGAIQWAVAESTRLGVPVQLVAVCPAVPDAASLRLPQQGGAERAETTRAELDTLTQKLRLSTDVLPANVEIGPPAETILRQLGDSADLVVLGHRDRHAAQRLFGGSTSIAVAGRSPVPAVVVPDSWAPSNHTTAPVVLGVRLRAFGQGYETDTEVMHEAFRRARDLKVALVAVYAWEIPALLSWSPSDITGLRDRVQTALDSLLDPWHEKYDDVELVTQPVAARPDDAIAFAARTAQVIVVGRCTPAAQHGSFHLGSTPRSLLHHTGVPVLVVPSARGRIPSAP